MINKLSFNLMNELNESETKEFKVKKQVFMEGCKTTTKNLEEAHIKDENRKTIWSSEPDISEERYKEDLEANEMTPDEMSFEDWAESWAYDQTDFIIEDLEENILPAIESQMNYMLFATGMYNSNYGDFKPSGQGGTSFNNIDEFKDYITRWDGVELSNENGNLVMDAGDHDGSIEVGLFTFIDDKAKILEDLGFYADSKTYAEEDPEFDWETDAENEFENSLYYGGIDFSDVKDHLDLLVPIKDTISGYGTTNESEKEEIKDMEDKLENDKDLKGQEITDIYNDIKEIKDRADREDRPLTEDKVTTPSGEYENEELNSIESKVKQAFKDYWAGNIKASELNQIKKDSGLSSGEISSLQYQASREDDLNEDMIDDAKADSIEKGLYSEAEDRKAKWHNFCKSMKNKGFLDIDNMTALSDNNFVDKLSFDELDMFKGLEGYGYDEIQNMVRKELEESTITEAEETQVTNLQVIKEQGNIYMLQDDSKKIIVGENYNESEHIIENAEIYENKEEADKDYLSRCEITKDGKEFETEETED